MLAHFGVTRTLYCSNCPLSLDLQADARFAEPAACPFGRAAVPFVQLRCLLVDRPIIEALTSAFELPVSDALHI